MSVMAETLLEGRLWTWHNVSGEVSAGVEKPLDSAKGPSISPKSSKELFWGFGGFVNVEWLIYLLERFLFLCVGNLLERGRDARKQDFGEVSWELFWHDAERWAANPEHSDTDPLCVTLEGKAWAVSLKLP